MKKHSLIKLIALVVSVAAMATVFSGCIFAYDEDADLAQVILEINPVKIEYKVPLYTDYLDLNGNPVYNDPESAEYVADIPVNDQGIVQAVMRTHDGNAIHKPKTDGSGNVLYVGKDTDGAASDKIEVTASDANIDKEQTSDRYFVEPVSGEEYFYIGLFDTGVTKSALWQKVSDGSTAYGKLSYDNGTPDNLAASSAFNYVEELPVIYFSSTASIENNFYWFKLTPVYVTEEYTSEKEEFFKITLINYFENYAYNLISEENYTVDEVFDYFIKNFYTSYLSRVEADAAVKSGDVEWGVTEINALNKAIYNGIDSQLTTLYKEIADDFGQNYPDISEEESSDSTYPTPGDEEEKDEIYDKDYKVWHITQEYERCIGHSTSANRNSLEREGVRRFVDYIESTIDDSYAISDVDRAVYETEIAEMRDACSTSAGIDKLYTQFYTYKVIKYMYGENEEFTMKTNSHKEFIGKDRHLSTDADIHRAYDELLANQKANFAADIENYYNACKNNETVLYFADDEYFWVKHILIPFSDAQTASLNAYKAGNNTDADIKAFRDQLGNAVPVYKHVNGENDTTKEYTINEAYSEINAKMKAASADPGAAEEQFNNLIYTYNTDPGIFDNEMGYAVTRTSEANGGAAESYMIEFAQEARALYYAYKNDESLYEYKSRSSEYEVSRWDAEYCTNEVEIGSISAPVLTDYGWHIMYLNYVPTPGYIRALNEYMTPAKYSTVKDVLGADISVGLDNVYTSWQETTAAKYSEQTDIIIPHKERFTKRLKDYEDRFYNVDTGEDDEESAASGGTSAS